MSSALAARCDCCDEGGDEGEGGGLDKLDELDEPELLEVLDELLDALGLKLDFEELLDLDALEDLEDALVAKERHALASGGTSPRAEKMRGM